jgi:hypothetical protein
MSCSSPGDGDLSGGEDSLMYGIMADGDDSKDLVALELRMTRPPAAAALPFSWERVSTTCCAPLRLLLLLLLDPRLCSVV